MRLSVYLEFFAVTAKRVRGSACSSALLLMSILYLNAWGWNYIGSSSPTGQFQYLPGYILALRFQASTGFDAKTMRIRIHTGAAGNMAMAVFSENSGKPHTLLGSTPVFSTVDTGWRAAALSPSVSISAGSFYWLAFSFDAAEVKVFGSDIGGDLVPLTDLEGYPVGSWPGTWIDIETPDNGLFAIIATDSAAGGPSKTWTGATNGSWNIMGNWAENAVPINNDQVIFHGNPGTTLATSNNLTGLTLSAIVVNNTGSSPVSIGMNPFTIGGGGIDMTTASKDLTVSAGIILGTAQSWSIAAARTLNVGGVISGSGALTKNGPGTLVLSGNNTFTNTVTINQGMVRFGHPNALGATGITTVNNGAILDLFGQTGVGEPLTISGNGISGSGAIINSGMTASTHTAPITLSGPSGIGGIGPITLTGSISGSGDLIKVGPGTLNLQNSSSTFTGETRIRRGRLQLTGNIVTGTPGVLGNSSTQIFLSDTGTAPNDTVFLLWSGGDFSGNRPITVGGNNHSGATTLGLTTPNVLTLSGSLTLQGNLILTAPSAGSAQLSGVISGVGGIAKKGVGEVVFSGSNTYSGPTTISEGVLRCGNVNALSGASAVTLANVTSAGLDINGYNQTIGSLSGGGGSGGFVNLGTGTLTSGQDNTSTVYSGVISGSGGLVKTGTGFLALTGTNTYTGPTTVNQGMLMVNGSLAAGTTVTLNNGILAGDGICHGNVISSTADTLRPGNGGVGTLSTGPLILNPGTVLDMEIGSVSDRIDVNGDLLLDGTVRITPVAGFPGVGTYTIMTYSGNLTDNVLVVGSMPSGYAGSIDLGTTGQVLLVVTLESKTLDLQLVGNGVPSVHGPVANVYLGSARFSPNGSGVDPVLTSITVTVVDYPAISEATNLSNLRAFYDSDSTPSTGDLAYGTATTFSSNVGGTAIFGPVDLTIPATTYIHFFADVSSGIENGNLKLQVSYSASAKGSGDPSIQSTGTWFGSPRIWDGGGADNNWTTAENWNSDAVPGPGDSVVFNAASDKNCILTADVEVRSIVFTSGYTGTFDFSNYRLTVQGTRADVRSGGALSAGTGSLEFTNSGIVEFYPKMSALHPAIIHSGPGTLRLMEGDLWASSYAQSAGILDFNDRNITTAGDFTITGGGSETFSGLGNRTVTVGGNASFSGLGPGNLLNMNPDFVWTLNVTGAKSASYAAIANCNASGGTPGTLVNCVYGGNALNWDFGKVVNVTSAKLDGIYGIDTLIPVQVHFDRPVLVTGSPQLSLETTISGGVVEYTSGSSSSILTFDYTVLPGHVNARLDYVSAAALAHNSGTIKDNNGNDVIVDLPPPGMPGSLGANKAIRVDGEVPVMSVTSPTAGTTVNHTRVSYTLSEPVKSGKVVWTRTGGMTDPGSPHVQTLTGPELSSGTHADITLTNSPTLVSGAVYTVSFAATDAAGNVATPVSVTGVTYSVSGPTVIEVTSPKPDGIYGRDTQIPVAIRFNRNVFVTGTPRLMLSAGPDGADYGAGSGSTTLMFNYVVAPGHAGVVLDYQSTTALLLNGGTIRDENGIDAVLALPKPGTTGSLGSAKSIAVDAKAPVNAGCESPVNMATGLSTQPQLVARTASDTPAGLHDLAYSFQVAPDTSFANGVLASGWIAGTTWTPPKLAAGATYYWRVKVRDRLLNESAWCGHRPDAAGYAVFTTSGATTFSVHVSTTTPVAGVPFTLSIVARNRDADTVRTYRPENATYRLLTNASSAPLGMVPHLPAVTASDFVNGVARISGVILYCRQKGPITFTITEESGAAGLSGTSMGRDEISEVFGAAPSRILFSAAGSTTDQSVQIAGTAFPVRVIATDQFGNHDTGYSTGTVELFGASHPPRTAPNGTPPDLGTPQLWNGGTALFSVTLYCAQAPVTLGVTSAGLTAHGNPRSFTVVPGAPALLVFVMQPSPEATAHAPFTMQPVVSTTDAFGNAAYSAQGIVSIAAVDRDGVSTPAEQLGGTTTAEMSGGKAVFTNLSYSRADSIRLLAKADSYAPAVSNLVAVSPQPERVIWDGEGFSARNVNCSTVVFSWPPQLVHRRICISTVSMPQHPDSGRWKRSLAALAGSDTLSGLPAGGVRVFASAFVRSEDGIWSPFMPRAAVEIDLADCLPPESSARLSLASVGDSALKVSVMAAANPDAALMAISLAYGRRPETGSEEMVLAYGDTSFVFGPATLPGIWFAACVLVDRTGNRSVAVHDSVAILNTAPRVVAMPDPAIAESQRWTAVWMGSDINGDPLRWDLVQGPRGLSIDTAGRASWTPGSDQIGEHVIVVACSDGRGAVTHDTLRLTVLAVNRPPNTLLKSRRIVQGAVRFELIGEHARDTGLVITSRLRNLADTTALSGPAPQGIAEYYPLIDGTYEFRAWATDSRGMDDPTPVIDTFTIRGASTRVFADTGTWQMIGIPAWSYPADSVRGNGVLSHWDESRAARDMYAYYVPSSEISYLQAGKGYWRRAPGVARVALRAHELIASDTVLSLKAGEYGWNQIASPYLYPVVWSDQAALWEWNSALQDYQEAPGVLEPWKGYWTQVDSDRTVGLTAAPVFRPSGFAKKTEPSFVSRNDWRIQVVLRSADAADAQNAVGFSPQACNGPDAQDLAEPPAVEGRRSLFFPRPEWGARITGYAADIRRSWEKMAIFHGVITPAMSQSDSAALSFRGVTALSGVYIFLAIDDTIVAVREGESYPVRKVRDTTCFAVIAAERRDIVLPTRFFLDTPHPNPLQNRAVLNYTLPYRWAGRGKFVADPYEVRIDILDAAGRKVRSLVHRRQEPGRYQVVWDARSNSGRRVGMGHYFLVVEAGPFRQTKKLIVNR